jgi:hypothetical protein
MNRGFVGLAFLIIVWLVILKYYFNWSILDASHTPRGEATITYIKEVLTLAWSYLSTPFAVAWNKIMSIFEITEVSSSTVK